MRKFLFERFLKERKLEDFGVTESISLRSVQAPQLKLLKLFVRCTKMKEAACHSISNDRLPLSFKFSMFIVLISLWVVYA